MEKQEVLPVITYAVIAALMYIIPMAVFMQYESFVKTWILYLGCFLFGIPIAIYMVRLTKNRKIRTKTTSMLIRGHLVTITGIVICAVAVLVALLIDVPNIFTSQQAETVLTRAPPQMQDGETNGLVLILFMTAVIGNFTAGSFFSIILAYTAKLNQTHDQEPDFLQEERER